MNLVEINFSEKLSIFTKQLDGIDNTKLANDLYLNCEVSKIAQSTSSKNPIPGIQSDVILVSENICKIKSKILDNVKHFLNIADDFLLYQHDWVFISNSENKIADYHTHSDGYNSFLCKEPPEWTAVYYVEVPDNLSEGEGRLYFKDENDDEYSILPEESQLIVFKANISHKPGLNLKSIKNRIVYACNFSIIDRNKKYNKKEKTLI
jgi:hypothetical protein